MSDTPWRCVEGNQGVSAVGVVVSPACNQATGFVQTLHIVCLYTQACASSIISSKVFSAGPGPPLLESPCVCGGDGCFWWAHMF